MLRSTLCFLAAACVHALGCGSDPPPAQDSGVPMEPATVMVGTVAEPDQRIAEYSCRGGIAPTAGALVPFTLELRDFQDDTPVSDVMVNVYPENLIGDGACTSPACLALTTDAMGHAAAMGHEGGWFGYRVLPKAGPTPPTTIVGAVAPNILLASSGSVVATTSLSQQTLNLIPLTFGIVRTPGTAILGTIVFECMGAPVRGAVVRLFGADGAEILPGLAQTDPHFGYFDGTSFPAQNQPFTNVDGLFAAVQLPVAGPRTSVRVEAWGRVTAGAEKELLGCEQVDLFSDTASLLEVHPARADGPPGCSP